MLAGMNTTATTRLALLRLASQRHLNRQDADLVIALALGVRREALYSSPEAPVSAAGLERAKQLIDRRAAGEPFAYLSGKKEFYGLPLSVDPNVLIPRPETELLVDLALSFLPGHKHLRVLDLGTGSGAIALALANARRDLQVFASDISKKALKIAAMNIKNLKISNLHLVCSDWMNCFGPTEKFDCILSNPPYIEANDPVLRGDGIAHEPVNALVADQDGLAAFRAIAMQAADHLNDNGVLIFEHGATQSIEVERILSKFGFSQTKKFHDLAGLPRAIIGALGQLELAGESKNLPRYE